MATLDGLKQQLILPRSRGQTSEVQMLLGWLLGRVLPSCLSASPDASVPGHVAKSPQFLPLCPRGSSVSYKDTGIGLWPTLEMTISGTFP